MDRDPNDHGLTYVNFDSRVKLPIGKWICMSHAWTHADICDIGQNLFVLLDLKYSTSTAVQLKDGLRLFADSSEILLQARDDELASTSVASTSLLVRIWIDSR